jgi:hypothetical protein
MTSPYAQVFAEAPQGKLSRSSLLLVAWFIDHHGQDLAETCYCHVMGICD